MRKQKVSKVRVVKDPGYIENIGELRGLNTEVQAGLIADALLNGKRIKRVI